jgi:Trk-type K+ transport system membrane component
VFTGMIALVAATTLILVYREAGTLEACTFEAVSACCNVGFSTGLTRSLSVEGRVAIILAMLLGRILPLALLARAVKPGR